MWSWTFDLGARCLSTEIKGTAVLQFNVFLDPPSDTGGSEITAHILEADDGKGTVLLHSQKPSLSL